MLSSGPNDTFKLGEIKSLKLCRMEQRLAKSLERIHKEECRLFTYTQKAEPLLRKFNQLTDEREGRERQMMSVRKEKRCRCLDLSSAPTPSSPMRKILVASHPHASISPPRDPIRYIEHTLQQRAEAKTYCEEINWIKCEHTNCAKWRKSLSDVK